MRIYGHIVTSLFSALPSVLASSDLFLCKRRCFKKKISSIVINFIFSLIHKNLTCLP